MIKRLLHTTAVHRVKQSSFKVNFPQTRERRKAWEGQDKDDFFRRKYAHVHADQKRSQNMEYDKRRQRWVDPSERSRRSGGSTNRTFGDRQLQQKQKTPRLKRDPLVEFLHGMGPVEAALRGTKRESYSKILTSRPIDELANIKSLAKQKSVPIESATRLDLNSMTQKDAMVNNGVVLQTQPLVIPDVTAMDKTASSTASAAKEFSRIEREFGKDVVKSSPVVGKKPHPLGLYIDQVTMAQNMGAIIRSAYYLGCDFVVISEKNCSPLSPVVAKTSVGAVDLLPIYNASKPLEFFEKSVANGWQLVATLPKKPTSDQQLVKPSGLNGLLRDGPCMLVLGSEGEGLRTSLANRATHVVSLKPHHASQIDSLNVSVATGILLSKFFDSSAFD